MLDFDEDTALLVLKQLAPKDLVCLQSTCKWGRTLARHDVLWKSLCAERFKTWNTQLFPASLGKHVAASSGDVGLQHHQEHERERV